jgi:hypothetical protein
MAVFKPETGGDLIASGDTSVSVHIHYHLGRGGYTGSYDFWTLVLEHPILSSVTAAFVYDVVKSLANKAVSLLKGATTPTKRTDIIIPFWNQSLVVARVICIGPAGEAGRIPSNDETTQAIASATNTLQAALAESEARKPLLVTMELSARKDTLDSRIHTGDRTGPMPGLENQIATAKSVKPTLLEAPEAKGTKARSKNHRRRGSKSKTVAKATRSRKRKGKRKR